MFIRSRLSIFAGAGALLLTPAYSQEEFNIRLRKPGPAGAMIVPGDPSAGVAFAPQGATLQFIAAEGGFGGKLVKNAPYTGEGISEFTQTLADGTRIKRQSSSKFARDSEGRTRTEHTIGSLGPWAPAGEMPIVANITDPVAGVVYLLNDKEKTAEKIKQISAKIGDGQVIAHTRAMAWKMKEKAGETEDVVIERHVATEGPAGRAIAVAGAPAMFLGLSRDAKTESLGKQNIEGLVCSGTRVIHTIAVGEVGNDRPIETVTETWYSPELQTVVMRRTNDPMSGETIYRLTNIRRSEPDRSLFEVPAGYTIREPEGPAFQVERKIVAPR